MTDKMCLIFEMKIFNSDIIIRKQKLQECHKRREKLFLKTMHLTVRKGNCKRKRRKNGRKRDKKKEEQEEGKREMKKKKKKQSKKHRTDVVM